MAAYDGRDVTTIDFDDCLRTTERAVLLVLHDRQLWLPRSVIQGEQPEQDGGVGTVDVRNWFLEKEGLI